MKSEPFIPHTLEHLTAVRSFPQPLPEAFYNGMLADFAKADDCEISRITYESDGLQVTGISCLPKNPTAAPILIYNRGGSREYGKLTLVSVMRSMLPFARKGYLVFASNYRGNDGGEGVEEFGGADVNDIVNLIALAKQHPAWDGQNIFMLGHSRGGMMNALTLKQGERFNAVVTIAGISDLRELQSPHMVENIFKPLIPGFLFAPEAALEARSAVLWPDALSAPLLLLHGDADKDVPPNHSSRLALALGKLQHSYELAIFEGGNHALIRHWDAVLDKCFSWFARYCV